MYHKIEKNKTTFITKVDDGWSFQISTDKKHLTYSDLVLEDKKCLIKKEEFEQVKAHAMSWMAENFS